MSQPRFNAEKAMICAISVVLSLLLWYQVTNENQVVKEKEFTAAIEYRGLPDTLSLRDETEYVQITLRGPASEVDPVNINDVKPIVVLRNPKPGSTRLPIRLAKIPGNVQVKFSRNEATLTLERMSRSTLSVNVETRGTLAEDLIFNGATTDPQEVTIEGPESAISQVKKIRVLVNLTQLRPGVSPSLDVEVLDKDDKPVLGATPNPARVQVIPSVSPARKQSTPLIQPSWNGQPAFGYRVKSFKITPSMVEVEGENQAIAKLQVLRTQPILIAGAKANVKGTIQLVLPEGVRLLKETPIQFEVVIEKDGVAR